MKLNKSHYFAIGLAGLLSLWMVSGVATKDPQPQPTAPALSATESAFPVQVQRFQNKEVSPELILHGATQASRTVHLSSEISGAVKRILKREGEFVKAGETVVELDAQDKPQQVEQAKALLKQRKLEHAASQNLYNKGLQNDTALAQSEVLLAQANAQLKQLQIQLDATRIKAPFSGVLENRKIELGTYVQRGDPVFSVLDYDPFIISAHVSEKDVASVNLNSKAQGRLITGEIVEGRIRYVSSIAAKTTRTFTVELEVPNPNQRMADGLTADILLPLSNTQGILVSPALLSLDEQGSLGIKYVDLDNRVVFGKVQLIKAQANGVWISGLPSNVDVITIGQSFVSSGDAVKPVSPQPSINTPEVATKDELVQP